MLRRPLLTGIAHQHLQQVLFDGAIAIDATLGNGHDALFLAERVGPTGRVYGFDIQTDAVSATRSRLDAAGLSSRATLLTAGHERMQELLPAELRGQIAAVTFNLGYLPGSDKGVRTAPASTLPALRQAFELLRPGGLLSVLAYRGHSGGQQEAVAVMELLQQQPGRLVVEESPGPVLLLLYKE